MSTLRKLMNKAGFEVSARTLERWCAQKKLPAIRKMGLGGRLTKAQTCLGGRYEWLVDLRELKTGSDEGRAMYEELINYVNEARF